MRRAHDAVPSSAYTSGVTISLSDAALKRDDASAPSRVLLVIGKALANLVAVTLKHGAYATRDCTAEEQCRELLRSWQPHMALIDIDHYANFMDIIGGGMTHGHIPILAFTRRREAGPKLAAYERGADDIIEVPFTLDEIIARPYALMRRSRGITTKVVPKINLGGTLEVDLLEQTVKMNGGGGLDLTPIQQTLLYVLAANTGDVMTRETLLATIWGSEWHIESNVVDRHIRELRVKLNDDWRSPRYIETVSGKGYRFREQIAQDGNAA
jgi:DNA-binding response OmpR family regulator